MIHLRLAAGVLVLQTGFVVAAPKAATGPDAAGASAEAQLAVAQNALCQAHKPLGPDADPKGTAAPPDDAAATRLEEACGLQRAAQAWVEAWDAAGRPQGARGVVARCRDDGVTARYIEALTQMTQGQFDAAQDTLAEAVQKAPKAWCAGLRLRQGVCALHRHKPEAALAFLQTAQGAHSKSVAIRVTTAQAYLALNRPGDAVISLKPILTEATEAPDSREVEQARALVGMAIEQDAGHISPLERTAMQNLLAMAQGSEADAQTVEMALSLAEAVPRSRVQTAAALVALKGQHVDAGRRLLKKAFTHATLDPDPARLLALYNVEHGGPGAALPCLTLAADRDPFNSETQTLIADLQERNGDTIAAQNTLVALMRLEPQQARHKAAWARLHHAASMPKQQRETP